MSITVNMTTSEVIEYLKSKIKIDVTPKFIENEFDGEALILLQVIEKFLLVREN